MAKAMYVSPTTMYFAVANLCKCPIYLDKIGICHVLYSMHSDYDEMRQFIKSMNVRRVVPFNDPFVPGAKVESISYCHKVFRDCIQPEIKESKQIFVPRGVNSKNVIVCERVAKTKQEKDGKLNNILAKLKKT